MIAAARSRIMKAPVSAAARISTNMPDGAGALPALFCEIAFLTSQWRLGWTGLPLVVRQTSGLGPRQTQH